MSRNPITNSNRRLIGIMNSHLDTGDGGISGGDMAFIQIVRRLCFIPKIVITPYSGEKICRHLGLQASFVNTSSELVHGNVPITWIKRALRAIIRMPKPENGDILYVASDFFVDVIPALYYKSKLRRSAWIQCVFHLIANPFRRQGCFFTNLVSFLLQRLTLFIIRYNADLVIVDSPMIKRELEKLGFESKKIHVGFVGTDINFIKRIPPASSHNYDAFFMGRFHQSKGIYDLIEIWKLVVKHDPKKRLALIGSASPKMKRYYEQLLHEHDLENNIFLLGFLPKAEAIAHIKSGKIFIFPSHEEGFGIVIVEAMACGKPVIAWDLDVYNEIFGDSMIRIPRWDIKVFADKCIKVMEKNDLYDSLKEAGLNTCQLYDWSKLAIEDQSRILTVAHNVGADDNSAS